MTLGTDKTALSHQFSDKMVDSGENLMLTSTRAPMSKPAFGLVLALAGSVLPVEPSASVISLCVAGATTE